MKARNWITQVPDRLIIGLLGLALAILFAAAPRIVLWWLGLFGPL